MAGKKTKTKTKKTVKQKAVVERKKVKKQLGPFLNKIVPVIVAILFLFTTTAIILRPKSAPQLLKESLLKNPNNQALYLDLIKQLISQNKIEDAERALKIAQQKFPESEQLQKLALEKKYKDPKELKVLISTWEEIVKQKPDYRDGFLKLAFFYYQLNDKTKALENLKKAKLLDPNYPLIEQMEKLIDES